MNIRKIKMEDANSYLEMLLNLDKETKFMMFEPEERSNSIDIARRKIENTIKGDNLILVATEGTEIIGFLSVERGVPRRIRHTGYVVVGIREKYRGMGIGSKLFSELDKWARENNLTRLELTVVSSNIVAKHLYEKNGFEIEGIKRKSVLVDGKYLDEFYMAKIK